MANKMAEQEIQFKKMTVEDIDDVVVIEEASFKAPWSRKSIAEEAENAAAWYLIARCQAKTVAYVGMQFVLDEAHIMNVAVMPDYRRHGIGMRMMQEAIRIADEHGCPSMTLEARVSNEAAIKMYEKLGFVSAGVRRDFYEKPREDGMIMWRHSN